MTTTTITAAPDKTKALSNLQKTRRIYNLVTRLDRKHPEIAADLCGMHGNARKAIEEDFELARSVWATVRVS